MVAVTKKEAMIAGVAVAGFETTWLVRRPFTDACGELKVGEEIEPERARHWTNISALRSMGMIEIWDGDGEQVDTSTPETDPNICPECGAGPFKRLSMHMTKAHKKGITDGD